MLEDKELEKAVHDLIMDICEIMYHRGYDKVCIGHMMRLVGVAEDRARAHDEEYFALDQDFKVMLDYRSSKAKNTKNTNKNTPRQTPDGVTLH